MKHVKNQVHPVTAYTYYLCLQSTAALARSVQLTSNVHDAALLAIEAI